MTVNTFRKNSDKNIIDITPTSAKLKKKISHIVPFGAKFFWERIERWHNSPEILQYYYYSIYFGTYKQNGFKIKSIEKFPAVFQKLFTFK